MESGHKSCLCRANYHNHSPSSASVYHTHYYAVQTQPTLLSLDDATLPTPAPTRFEAGNQKATEEESNEDGRPRSGLLARDEKAGHAETRAPSY